MPRISTLILLLLAVTLEGVWSFGVLVPQSRASPSSRIIVIWSAADESSEGVGEDEEVIATSVVKIDDGGSDLTDRFKWKVNALMGVFDPQGEDDERQDGNIMNAILNFPVLYSWNVVGRTGGDDAVVEEFITQVKEVVMKATGDEDGIQCQIIPRSKNFTKVTIRANVQNADMISAAYDSLEALKLTVMRF